MYLSCYRTFYLTFFFAVATLNIIRQVTVNPDSRRLHESGNEQYHLWSRCENHYRQHNFSNSEYCFRTLFKPLPRHSHGNNSYELHYIPNGLGQAVIDGSSYELTPGTLYMTGPHVEHEQIPSPMDPMTEYSIYFQLQEEDALLVFPAALRTNF